MITHNLFNVYCKCKNSLRFSQLCLLVKLTGKKTYATLLHGWAVVIPKEIVNYHWCHTYNYYWLKGFFFLSPTQHIPQELDLCNKQNLLLPLLNTSDAAICSFLYIYSSIKLAVPLSFFHGESKHRQNMFAIIKMKGYPECDSHHRSNC